MGIWGVVEDAAAVRATVPEDQFRRMNHLARGAIMRGVPKEDAEIICHEQNAQDMWTAFVDKQTKRDSYVKSWFITSGEFLTEEFAEILLGNVSQTHRDVVRQFLRHYDPGFKRATPASSQVMYALRAESELDARREASPQDQNISSAQTGKKQGKRQGQQQGKEKTRGRGRYKAKANSNPNRGESGGKQSGKKKSGEDTRDCWNCHEIGHIQANCPHPRRQDDESGSLLPERKRWQNKKSGGSGGKNSGNRGDIDMLSRRDCGSETVAMQNSMSSEVEWVLDSASDCHVCTNKELLSNLYQDDGPLLFDWEGKPSKNKGLVGELEVRVQNENRPSANALLLLSNVLYTPSGTNNLLSLDKLERDGWDFIKLKKQKCAWLRKDSVLLMLAKMSGRYRLQSTANSKQQVEAVMQGRCDDERALVRWHTRLGHLNYGDLRRMVRDGTVDGLVLSGSVGVPSDRCWMCVQSRMKRMSYKKVRTTRSTVPYQKLMSDECYLGVDTYNGYKHFQLAQDEASRYVWGFLLKRKDESCDAVVKQVSWLLAQQHRIEVFSSDPGRELVNTRFEAFPGARGIFLTTTNAYCPEENGLVERMHGVVLSRVRSLLTTVDLPNLLWGEAFAFALEVLNISPSSALAGETPYTRCFGECPDLSTLRTWGCLAFYFTEKVLRKNKLENPGKPCVFLGYAWKSISYRVMDLKSGDIKELRVVEFDEDWTVEHDYVEKLQLNRYSRAKYKLPSRIPYVRLDGLTSPSTTISLGGPDSDDHHDKRQCSEDLRDLRSSTVVDTPAATGGPALASSPVSGVLRVDPTREAEAETRVSRARELWEWNPAVNHTNPNGGGGAEGGEDLSNRSCSAPFEGGGDLPNRSISRPSQAPLALSDSDD